MRAKFHNYEGVLMVKEFIDDYNITDCDLDELIKLGQEWFEWEAQQIRSESMED